ncbi:MAG: TerC family protein [Candidatus Binatia bacterium]
MDLEVLHPEFWARALAIAVLDLTLAGDNALVIALAVRKLPPRQQLLGRLWGTAGALGLRLAFIAIISAILTIPLVQLVGGLLLLWVAWRLVQHDGREGEEVRHGSSLREAVWIIVVADAVMSLDNVLGVAAAAHGDMLLVVFGIGLSLPIVVWGSGVLARWMSRFPWIVWIGGGILGYVAGEMILRDPLVVEGLGEHVVHALHYLVPGLLAATFTAFGWWFARARAVPA